MKSKIRKIVSLVICVFTVAAVCLAAPVAAFTGPYEMQNWSSPSTGGIVTSISPSSGPATIVEFSYEEVQPYYYTYEEATFSTTAALSGPLTFDWTYSFFHSWYQVYADLYVFADGPSGTNYIHEVDFYQWGYAGPQTFSGSTTIWVEEGYDFGFIVGGKNYCATQILEGTLTISNFGYNVEIDIKPGSLPNSINPNYKGVIPVAILTTTEFDASTVDPQTVALEGAGALSKGKSGKYGAMEDVDGDGDLDLVVQIMNEIDWVDDATDATLTGITWDGLPIAGTDSVNIVPPNR